MKKYSALKSWLLLLMLFPLLSIAETTLQVSADRDSIYLNEVLNLTIQADTEVELSLGGLMNFGGRQVEAPKFEGLEQNWEIIDRQQSYNMQSINGNARSTITWRYALSPKSQGLLQVPPATFKNARSKPLTINVQSGSRPRDEANPPAVFLKASVDKANPYLQEQIIYSLKLFTLGDARGDMSEPSHPDLIIEPLGETTKTFEMAYGRRYEVYERQYLLFAQRSGTMEVDPQIFTGNLVDPRSLRRVRVREVSNKLSLEIKPPPAGFSGDTWLPATSLFLSDSLEPDSGQLKRGESITRKINITALGLLGSALPEIEVPEVANLKVYPDQPEISSIEHGQGVQSSRTETRAFVAIQEGSVTLPEISIVWWDTVNDIERVANLPARELSIAGGASLTPNNEAFNTVTGQETTKPTEQANKKTGKAPITEGTVSDQNIDESNLLWPILVATILTLWFVHVMILHRKLLSRPDKLAAQPITSASSLTLKDVLASLASRTPDAPSMVYRWIKETLNKPNLSSADLARLHPELEQWLLMLEAEHFSNKSQANDEAQLKSVADEIANVLKTLRAESASNGKENAHALKPFYPV